MLLFEKTHSRTAIALNSTFVTKQNLTWYNQLDLSCYGTGFVVATPSLIDISEMFIRVELCNTLRDGRLSGVG